MCDWNHVKFKKDAVFKTNRRRHPSSGNRRGNRPPTLLSTTLDRSLFGCVSFSFSVECLFRRTHEKCRRVLRFMFLFFSWCVRGTTTERHPRYRQSLTRSHLGRNSGKSPACDVRCPTPAAPLMKKHRSPLESLEDGPPRKPMPKNASAMSYQSYYHSFWYFLPTVEFFLLCSKRNFQSPFTFGKHSSKVAWARFETKVQEKLYLDNEKSVMAVIYILIN